MKTLTIRMPDDLHKELKILSVSLGVTMSELLMKAVHIITKQKGIEETTFLEAFEKPLSDEPFCKLRVISKMGQRFLDDYPSLEPGFALHRGQKDFCHPANGYSTQQFVSADGPFHCYLPSSLIDTIIKHASNR